MDGITQHGTEDASGDAGRDAGRVPAGPVDNGVHPTDTGVSRPVGDGGHGTLRPASPSPTVPTEPVPAVPKRDAGRFRRLFGGRAAKEDTGRPVPTPVPPANLTRDTKPARRRRTRDAKRDDRPSPWPRRTPRRGTSAKPTARETFGRLTYNKSGAAKFGMVVLGCFIAISLTAVVIAPPTLSAQDILDWARLDSPGAGLGLDGNWPWVVFLALDFSAAVCVLVSLYCAFNNESAGWFGVGVWMFAGMTAYANYNFNNVPGAPGDGIWFFPLMSVVGPLMLHWMTKKIRGWVLDAAGGGRSPRPKFDVWDWFPLSGSPQATFGAWRIGGQLGVSVPGDALALFRVLSRDRGWWRRWSVNGVVRKAVYRAMDDEFGEDELPQHLVALLLPGLVPATEDDDAGRDAERPPSRDPLDELENDILGVPSRTARNRGTRPAPVSGPPSPTTVPRPPTFEARDTGRGTPEDDSTAGRYTADTRPHADPLGTRDAGRDATGHGTGDAFDPDLLKYADFIFAIIDGCPGWQTELPGARRAAGMIDAHWKSIGRATTPGGEPGFNSRSTAARVLQAMDRLAVQHDIDRQIANLRSTRKVSE